MQEGEACMGLKVLSGMLQTLCDQAEAVMCCIQG